MEAAAIHQAVQKFRGEEDPEDKRVLRLHIFRAANFIHWFRFRRASLTCAADWLRGFEPYNLSLDWIVARERLHDRRLARTCSAWFALRGELPGDLLAQVIAGAFWRD